MKMIHVMKTCMHCNNAMKQKLFFSNGVKGLIPTLGAASATIPLGKGFTVYYKGFLDGTPRSPVCVHITLHISHLTL